MSVSIGLGIGVVFGLLAGAALGVFVLYRQRH